MTGAAASIEAARGRTHHGQFAVAFAALAWSTAGVLQRQLTVPVVTQLTGRALFAAAAIALYLAVAERGRMVAAWRSIGRAGVGFAACVAVASGSFIVALNYATVAQVLFIQAIGPVLAALLGRGVLGEPISVRTMIAMAAALLGVGVMIGGPGGGSALGDGLSVLMATAFAVAVVIARHRRDTSMAPATCLAQLMLLVVGVPIVLAGPGVGAVGDANLAWLALLGAGQIGVGLVLLTIGARLILAAQIALISLLEVVLGPLWVWLAIGERPGATTLIGGAVVIGAVALQALGGSRAGALPEPPPVT